MSSNWPQGVGRRILEDVDSTNAFALRSNEGGPAWIMARRQTAARGRRGRAWLMPAGNFAASYVFRPEGSASEAALYSFVAALALRDALDDMTDHPLALKWPNDVLLSGGKVAGILLESVGTGDGLDRLVVGFGVNVAAAPSRSEVEPETVPPVCLGRSIDPEDLLDRLAPAFAVRDAAFRAHGFRPLRDEWLSHAARLGEEIVARTGGQTRAGRFETVDDTGALVLATASGRSAISAADIHF
ncbi:biotin--[acetyl-CoA-carboxylase] ligase [Roseitranquillus sediminis]|uniref:biotin--[acetyl-CoA-carboxylase] ligase n=1 Tax=Roseitranquillus sediminis TaxID=2809051 RepID=UPI001D0C88C3|nr:biotin--[acetyl-CoA-carboxylase] ligase [Roseitranquillus sediminis]MBM9594097.1 biotin--[acetyl-CoA-carboxylase] ligase [Roseitranquillus sediminis]